ncbi:MAG: O-acetyl-ADP-ribose deacetylase [Bacteroidales bacterium]|nr:O-acetyl-ADP-ribose deacetylase [Bacteroidales bacterium]MBN2819589.1 O-acetyl-ADP-ribose deacetylase [Bacteroidales bacterium]
MFSIELIQGDITKLRVEAVVNAANNSLLGGGGVDGAIHRAAGPELLAECKTLKGCATGEAKITKAYNLPAKWVIHTVGPVWHGGTHNEAEQLHSCYEKSLLLAEKNKVTSIAFPNISTGIYSFPKEQAAGIALAAVKGFRKKTTFIQEVIFVVFDMENYAIYSELLQL